MINDYRPCAKCEWSERVWWSEKDNAHMVKCERKCGIVQMVVEGCPDFTKEKTR